MVRDTLKIREGLRKLPADNRDFQLGAMFPQTKYQDIPFETFSVEHPSFQGIVKDQGGSDMCTAFTITSVSEDQEAIELSPEYQFKKIKEITGKPDAWGADLRSACKSAVKYGSIPKHLANSYMKTMGIETIDRNAIVNHNWDEVLDDQASIYSKESFFSIEGFNLFDALRNALWTHRAENRSIAVGAKWRQEWTEAPLGIIPTEYGDEGFGHAFKICGQDVINGELYLRAKLSNGKTIGDRGYFFFPKTVVNKEFHYGAFMFKDIPAETVKVYIKSGIKSTDHAIIKFIKRLLTKFIS